MDRLPEFDIWMPPAGLVMLDALGEFADGGARIRTVEGP